MTHAEGKLLRDENVAKVEYDKLVKQDKACALYMTEESHKGEKTITELKKNGFLPE